MGPEIVVPLGFFIMAPVAVIGIMLTRAHVRRQERESIAAPQARELDARLERMEQAMDAIAVEIERIAEAQRFTTKLLSERSEGAGAGGAPRYLKP